MNKETKALEVIPPQKNLSQLNNISVLKETIAQAMNEFPNAPQDLVERSDFFEAEAIPEMISGDTVIYKYIVRFHLRQQETGYVG